MSVGAAVLSVSLPPGVGVYVAIYTVFTSPTHTPLPNHLPTLIVTPHGQPSNILYSYLHTNFNTENYLLTPSHQGDLCVAKLFPPRQNAPTRGAASDPGHGSSSSSKDKVVRCEASRNLKWTIQNTGVMSPIYKLSLPAPEGADLPLFLISKPNPNATHWSMFYSAYAGHLIPPKRIEFGKIQKNLADGGGGTRIAITGKTPEEKAVWQTLGEGNEDCVEWVVLCAALNLLDDEILRAAEKNGPNSNPRGPGGPQGPPPPMPGPGPGGPGPGPGPGSGPASMQASPRLPQGLPQQQRNVLQRPHQGPPPGQGFPPNGAPPPGRGFDPRMGPPPDPRMGPPSDPRMGPPPGGMPPLGMDPRMQGPPPGHPQYRGPPPGPGQMAMQGFPPQQVPPLGPMGPGYGMPPPQQQGRRI